MSSPQSPIVGHLPLCLCNFGPTGLVANIEPARAFGQLFTNQESHAGTRTMTPAQL